MLRNLFKRNIGLNKVVNSIAEKRLLKSLKTVKSDFDRFKNLTKNNDYSDQILRELNGDYTKLSRLLDDSHVHATVQARKSASLSMNYQLLMNGVRPEIAEFINKVFKEYDIANENEKIIDCILYGWVPIELVWKITSDYWTITDYIQHPHSWFEIDKDGLVYHRTKSFSKDKKLVSPDKLIIVSNGNTSLGKALLSKCYYPVKFKDAAFEYWIKFAEKFGSPLWHAEVGNAIDDDTLDDIESELISARESGVLITKEQMKINLINGANQSTINVYNNLIGVSNIEISKAILSQTLTTEIGNVGSYAASQTHLQIMDFLVKSDIRIIEKFWNNIIKLLVKKNFIVENQDTLPKLEMFPEPKATIEEANKTSILANTGVKFNKKYYENNFHLQQDEFDIVDVVQNAPQQIMNAPENDIEFKEKVKINNAFEEIQDVIDSWDGKTEINDLIDDMINGVQNLIKSGKSFKSIQNEIIKYIDDDTLADTFASKLENLYFNTFLHGVVNGEKKI